MRVILISFPMILFLSLLSQFEPSIRQQENEANIVLNEELVKILVNKKTRGNFLISKEKIFKAKKLFLVEGMKSYLFFSRCVCEVVISHQN